MKPSPRPRKTPAVPKAVGPDPALIGASSTSRPSSSSPASDASSPSDAGATSDTDSASDTGRSARAGTRPRGQLSIWMDADALGRARTAWRAQNATSLDRPYQTFGQWVAAIIEQAVTDAERRLNAGQRFDPTPPGQIGHSNPHH